MFTFDLSFLKVDELFVSVVEPAKLSTPSNTLRFHPFRFPFKLAPEQGQENNYVSKPILLL